MSVRRFSNPDQAMLFNGPKFHEGLGICCGDTLEPCAYDFKAAAAISAATSITFVGNAGTNVTVPLTGADTPRKIRKAIAAAFKANNIDPYYPDPYVSFRIVGDLLRIVSTVPVSSVTLNGSPVAASEKCNLLAECTYLICIPYDTTAGELSDGTDSVAIGTAGGFEAGNAAAVATAFDTTLAGLSFDVVGTPTVTEDVLVGQYKIVFTLVKPTTIVYAEEALSPVECFQGWSA